MQIVLHTAKAIALDKARPDLPSFTDAGTQLAVPSQGLTLDRARRWIKEGAAAEVKRAAK